MKCHSPNAWRAALLLVGLILASSANGQGPRPLDMQLQSERKRLEESLRRLRKKETDHDREGEKLDKQKKDLDQEGKKLKGQEAALKREKEQTEKMQKGNEASGTAALQGIMGLNAEAANLEKRKAAIEAKLKDATVSSVRLREALRGIDRELDALAQRAEALFRREEEYRKERERLRKLLSVIDHRYEDHRGGERSWTGRSKAYEEARFQHVRRGLHLSQEREELGNRVRDYHRRAEAYYGKLKPLPKPVSGGRSGPPWRIDFDDTRPGKERYNRYRRNR